MGPGKCLLSGSNCRLQKLAPCQLCLAERRRWRRRSNQLLSGAAKLRRQTRQTDQDALWWSEEEALCRHCPHRPFQGHQLVDVSRLFSLSVSIAVVVADSVNLVLFQTTIINTSYILDWFSNRPNNCLICSKYKHYLCDSCVYGRYMAYAFSTGCGRYRAWTSR